MVPRSSRRWRRPWATWSWAPALAGINNIDNRALTGVGAGLLEWGVTSPSEAVYVCLLVFNQSGDGLASFSGAYRTRKSFGWPSLSSKSLCKSSLFFTFIFQSMGRYTWERGRYQFAMGKKKYWFCIWIIDIFLTFQRFCRYIPMLIEALSCKISEKLV